MPVTELIVPDSNILNNNTFYGCYNYIKYDLKEFYSIGHRQINMENYKISLETINYLTTLATNRDI